MRNQLFVYTETQAKGRLRCELDESVYLMIPDMECFGAWSIRMNRRNELMKDAPRGKHGKVRAMKERKNASRRRKRSIRGKMPWMPWKKKKSQGAVL